MKLLAVPIPIFERFNPYCFGFAVELRVANAKSVANLLFQSLLFWICRRTLEFPALEFNAIPVFQSLLFWICRRTPL